MRSGSHWTGRKYDPASGCCRLANADNSLSKGAPLRSDFFPVVFSR